MPDRIPYARKRAERGRLPAPADRAREVAGLHARAAALPGWPQSLEPLQCEVVDHAAPFALDALPAPARAVTAMAPGAAVVGRLAGAAGPDLHLADGLVVDTRLLAGWELVAPGPGRTTDVPTAALPPAATVTGQDGLF